MLKVELTEPDPLVFGVGPCWQFPAVHTQLSDLQESLDELLNRASQWGVSVT